MAAIDPSVRTATEPSHHTENGAGGPEAAALGGLEGTDIEPILRSMAAKLGADAALLTVHDGRSGEPKVYADSGQALGSTVLEDISGHARDALARGEPVARRLHSTPRDGNGADAEGEVDEVVIAPVRAASGTTGALSLGWIESPAKQRQLVLKGTLSYAALIGLWLDDPPSFVGLVQAFYKDGLTGCLTFAALVEALEQELRRSQRTGQPLSCLFIDLDGFKEVNDSDGHLMGNRVLTAVGEGILSRARSTDIVARYGGDEFVVVLPDTGALGAGLLADSLRATISESIAAVLGRPVEASVGVTEGVPGMTAPELLERADQALDQARRRRGIHR